MKINGSLCFILSFLCFLSQLSAAEKAVESLADAR